MSISVNLPITSVCYPWAQPSDIVDQALVTAVNNTSLVEDCLLQASDILYRLSGNQFAGSCEDTVRPHARMVPRDHGRPIGMPGIMGYGVGYWSGGYSGTWGYSNWGWCTCNQDEDPGGSLIPQIALGVFPLTGIVQVLVDGVVQDPSTYRIDDNRYLVRLADPNTPTGTNAGWPCFVAGTLVTTERGQVPIEQVKVGDRVLTHRGRWQRVTKAGKTGDSETVRVVGRGGTIRCTPDHQFWASEVTEREPSRSGAWNRANRKLGAPDWVEAQHLVGQTWATPRRAAALAMPPLPVNDTPAWFWWLVGRWVGDGWTSEGDNRVGLCCGKHEVETIREALSGTGWDWRENEERTTFRFRVGNARLRDWLREHFGHGAASKQIPSWLLTAPEDVRRDFLNGYVSADGWKADVTGHAPFTSVQTVSRALATSLRLLVASLGYAPTMYEGRQTTTHIEGRTVTSQTPYRVDWSEKAPGGPLVQAWTDDDHLWGRVRAVELDEGVVAVYDIEVEEDHSFVADGFVVHNCCQRMDLPPTSVGTWQVQFTYGLPPPSAGVAACAELAYQFLLLRLPSIPNSETLPARIKELTRQGINALAIDPMDFLIHGRTGLIQCDYFIQAFNPHGLRRRAKVLSPDIGRRTRHTGPTIPFVANLPSSENSGGQGEVV